MAKFNFNLRDAKSIVPTPIYLIIRWDNKTLKISTQETIHPNYWNEEKQMAIKTKSFPEYPEFNLRLSTLSLDATNLFRTFVNDNKRQPSRIELKQVFEEYKNGLTEKETDLLNFIEKYIDESKIRHGKYGPISKNTIKLLNQLYRLIQEFSTYKRKRFQFDDISLDFYYDFLKYMKNNKRYATNTMGKRIKDLKTILNDATERGINTKYDYKSKRFKILSEETESIYLTENELDLLFALDLSNNERLERVRDLFLIGCWTGLRYGDWHKVKKEDINEKHNEIKTQKTHTKVAIPYLQVAKTILNKYDGILPRKIANQNMNLYLKELCSLVPELNKLETITQPEGGMKVSKSVPKYTLVATHTARRSFATNMYLMGVPIPSIMAITGHKTEKQFMEYIKITPSDHAKIVQLHVDERYKHNNL
jgi:site-specific recombinase XerD